MGVVVRGRMKRFKTKSEEQVKVAINGQVVMGETEREHKEWVPTKVVELYEGFAPSVKENHKKDGSVSSIQYVGNSRFTQLDKEALARIITKSGKIPDMNKPKKYWGFRYFRGRQGGGFDDVLAEPKREERFSAPVFFVGEKINIKGIDYTVTSKRAGVVGLVDFGRKRKRLKLAYINTLIKKKEAYKIVGIKNEEVEE